MKRTCIFLLLLSLGISGSTGQKPAKKIIHITVIDKKNGLPVNDAEVTLTTIVKARDVFREIQLTDKTGQCIFSFMYNPSADYGVVASKKGYLGFLEDDPVKISKSDARITADSETNISLYLTSDSMHQVEFYRKTEKRYEIPDLIVLLKSGNFHGGIPLLYWDDIPKLLAAGTDPTMISSFPANPLSSFAREAPLGMIALWLIESIRIADGNRFIMPWEKYPSLNPVIRNLNGPDNQEGGTENMAKLHQAYVVWWNSVKDMDTSHRCGINPLDGTGMRWK